PAQLVGPPALAHCPGDRLAGPLGQGGRARHRVADPNAAAADAGVKTRVADACQIDLAASRPLRTIARLGRSGLFRGNRHGGPFMARIFGVLGGLLIATLLVGGPLVYSSFRQAETRNFRVVRDGVLYRSGQMRLSGMKRMLRDYGIKT